MHVKNMTEEERAAFHEAQRLYESQLREHMEQVGRVPGWLLERLEDAWRDFNYHRIVRKLSPLPGVLAKNPILVRVSWDRNLADGDGKLPAVDLGGELRLVLEERFE